MIKDAQSSSALTARKRRSFISFPSKHAVAFLFLIALASRTPAIASNPISWRAQNCALKGSVNSGHSIATVQQANAKALALIQAMDASLQPYGGVGEPLEKLAQSLSAPPDYNLAGKQITLDQLHTLLAPIYGRLLAIGYNSGPLASGTYPWLAPDHRDDPHAPVTNNIVDSLFDIDLSFSASGSAIPDWWLAHYHIKNPGKAIESKPVPWSGGQVTYLRAYQQTENPVDYFNGKPFTLKITGGDHKTAAPGRFISFPLQVHLADASGSQLAGAPITLATANPGAKLQLNSRSNPTTSVTTLTDESGDAKVYFQLPLSGSAITVIATTGPPAAKKTLTFTELLGPTDSHNPSPFEPSNVTGSVNPDNSEEVHWENNDSGPIYIYLQKPDDSWIVTGTLPAGTTSYHVAPLDAGSIAIGNDFTPGGSTGLPPPASKSASSLAGNNSSGNNSLPASSPHVPGSPPFVPIPAQSYAAIDISGPDIKTPVTLSISDVNNNFVFGTYTSPDKGGLPNNYAVYSWKAGVRKLIQNAPVISGTAPLSILAIDLAGNAYAGKTGQSPKTKDQHSAPIHGPASAYYLIQAGKIHLLQPPAPFPTSSSGRAHIDLFNVGNYGAWFGMNYSGTGNAESVSSTLYSNGTYTIFDHQLASDPTLIPPHNTKIVDAYFAYPKKPDPHFTGKITKSGRMLGFAIDYRSGYQGYAYWNGQNLIPVPGVPIDLNDSGFVIGTSVKRGAYLWQPPTRLISPPPRPPPRSFFNNPFNRPLTLSLNPH